MPQLEPGPCKLCDGPTELAFTHHHCLAECDKPAKRIASFPCEMTDVEAGQALLAGKTIECTYCSCASTPEGMRRQPINSDVGQAFVRGPDGVLYGRVCSYPWIRVPNRADVDLVQWLKNGGWGGHLWKVIETAELPF